MSGADGTQLLPKERRHPLARRRRAARRGGSKGNGGNEIERAKEGNGWVQKRDTVGPGDILVGVGTLAGPDENLVPKEDGAVGRVGGVPVPFPPPAGAGVAEGTVVGVAAVKIDAVSAAGATGGRSRFEEAGFQVHRNQIPSGPESTLRKVLNEEHSVGTGHNAVVQRTGRVRMAAERGQSKRVGSHGSRVTGHNGHRRRHRRHRSRE